MSRLHYRRILVTASTSFANPAVTLARSLADTFAGIAPSDVPAFIVAQLLGAAAATVLFRFLLPPSTTAAQNVVLPHQRTADADGVA